MKYITFLLLLIAVNCKAQKDTGRTNWSGITVSVRPPFGEVDPLRPMEDTLPKNGIISIPINWGTSHSRILYKFVIYRYGTTTPVCYLDKDSALHIMDSLETINTLIKSELMHGEEIKNLYDENEHLRKLIKQMKGNQAVYAKKKTSYRPMMVLRPKGGLIVKYHPDGTFTRFPSKSWSILPENN